MKENPLLPSENERDVRRLFLNHFGFARCEAPPGREAQFLEAVARAFGRLPFENLTKIIRHHEEGGAGDAWRTPQEVLQDHVRSGTGGTCFSLTTCLLALLRSFGYEAQPVLADRRYGPDTHSALLVTLGGEQHLLDPGYLIFSPISVEAAGEKRITTSINEIILRPERGGSRLALSTQQSGSEAYRLTYKLPGADPGEFLQAWKTSFTADMMRYPVLTRILEDRQHYLQKNRFKVRDRSSIEKSELSRDELVEHIHRHFGISRQVAARALEIIDRREGLDD